MEVLKKKNTMCVFSFQIDTSGNGSIDAGQLKTALDGVGYKIPGWEVRLHDILFYYYRREFMEVRQFLS